MGSRHTGQCLIAAAITLAGCSLGNREARTTAPEARASSASAPASLEPGARAAGEAVAEEEPTPLEGISIALAGGALSSSTFSLVVQNRGDQRLALSSRVAIERATPNGFVPVEGAHAELRLSCDAEPTECITLVPGAELHPPGWKGLRGASPCACEGNTACTPVEPGEYRFVLSSCDGKQIGYGSTFVAR